MATEVVLDVGTVLDISYLLGYGSHLYEADDSVRVRYDRVKAKLSRLDIYREVDE
jgi:hypothetical protein